ncbi:MAG: sulfotransferase family 2 domain-containing protein [Paracoccaceae bacterium]|nr:MAG: sulfotransferase family 2 domain-containing protein [Paracoccaceae bacterium]
MIISRGRRYVFVHVPKTGGTALALALEARAMADDILIGDTPKARQRRGRVKGMKAAGRLWKHSTLADIDGLVTTAELAELFTVTMVRNPWDRAVSYYHWLRGQGFAHPAVGLAKALDFKGFLGHPQTRAAFRLWPYGAYMRDAAGVERARCFIRLEHFASDAAPFETHLGFRLPLVRSNASDRAADWRPYYDDASAALLAELCAEDVARFGYGFDDAAGEGSAG